MRDIKALRAEVVAARSKFDELYAAAEAANWSAETGAAYEAQKAILTTAIAAEERQEAHLALMRGEGAKQIVKGDEGKFGTFADMLMAVYKADTGIMSDRRMDDRLIGVSGSGKVLGAATGLNEGLGSDGGFLVQKDFVGPLMTLAWDNSEILRRIRRVEVGPNSNGIIMNGVDEKDRANGARWGGIYAYWLAEAAQKQPSRPQFKKIEMQLQKLVILAYATDELLQDTTALSSWLDTASRNEFNFRMEDSILNGTGVGMPEGILFSDALLQVTPDAGTTLANGITPPDIANMYASMPPSSISTAAWFVSPDLHVKLMFMAQIFTHGDDGIAALPGQITYTPPGTNGNQFGMLLGLPVIPTEYNAAVGSVGDIVLADMSQYLGITKGDVEAMSSIHVRFIYDETAFRFVYRFNGKSMWTSAIKPKNGIIYRSPFIVLGPRNA